MREETETKIIFSILEEKFQFDGMDLMAFVTEYERRSNNHIPDNWLNDIKLYG